MCGKLACGNYACTQNCLTYLRRIIFEGGLTVGGAALYASTLSQLLEALAKNRQDDDNFFRTLFPIMCLITLPLSGQDALRYGHFLHKKIYPNCDSLEIQCAAHYPKTMDLARKFSVLLQTIVSGGGIGLFVTEIQKLTRQSGDLQMTALISMLIAFPLIAPQQYLYFNPMKKSFGQCHGINLNFLVALLYSIVSTPLYYYRIVEELIKKFKGLEQTIFLIFIALFYCLNVWLYTVMYASINQDSRREKSEPEAALLLPSSTIHTPTTTNATTTKSQCSYWIKKLGLHTLLHMTTLTQIVAIVLSFEKIFKRYGIKQNNYNIVLVVLFTGLSNYVARYYRFSAELGQLEPARPIKSGNMSILQNFLPWCVYAAVELNAAMKQGGYEGYNIDG